MQILDAGQRENYARRSTGLDPFLALAGSRCRTKVPHPPPNLPKWQDHHGVKPPAQRVIRPGPGRQREKNGFVLTTPWYDTPCSHDVNVLINQRARAIEEARELEAALYAKRQEIAKYEEEIAEYRTLKALLPV
ncbi:hypothetical protein RRG08_018944 [Elysia crispata]|uniref:Uncharacterized protein n=1 Tax=Elysia crispata TaxID=231223 RepID=A0AAE1A6W8_9GAST|nr:hypothetical protein RRG08_018944 [Elysia crispata]